MTAPHPARAGHYSGPIYTGGDISYTVWDGTIHHTCLSPDDWGGYESQAQGDDASASGTLTATFTWQPDPGQTLLTDPPPKQVLVTQWCAAGWLIIGAPLSAAPGSCDDGLGDAPVLHGPHDDNDDLYGDGTDVPGFWSYCYSGLGDYGAIPHYSVQAGGATVTVDCTPTITNGTAGDTSMSPTGRYIDIYYPASVGPVTIDLDGTTNINGVQEAPTGQQVAANIYCDGPGTITSYQWSTSGGSPFKTYNPSLSSNQLVPLSAANGDYTGSSFYFFDTHNNDAVTVTCTATITFPGGTTATVNAAALPLTFMKPTAVWTVKEGYVQPWTSPKYPGASLFGIRPDPASTAQYPEGEDWYNVSITMPTCFSAAGQGCFAQIWEPSRWLYVASQNKTIYDPNAYGLGAGLDNQFPIYGYTWSLPGVGNSGDNPSIQINPSTLAKNGCVPGVGDYYAARSYRGKLRPRHGMGTAQDLRLVFCRYCNMGRRSVEPEQHAPPVPIACWRPIAPHEHLPTVESGLHEWVRPGPGAAP